MTLASALLVAAGAALGAPLRYLVDRWIQTRARGHTLPWGTFTVNVTGSFLLGLCLGAPLPAAFLTFAATGFCGAFTTWSALAYELVVIGSSDRRRAGSHLGLTVAAGLGAALVGVLLGTSLQ